LNNIFDKIYLKNHVVYVNKNFRNSSLEHALSDGEQGLQQSYILTTIPSSDSSRIYKFTVNFDGAVKDVYFKQYLYVSAFRFLKNLFRTSRASRDLKATLMLAKNGFSVPAIIAMGRRRFNLLRTSSFLATLAVKDSKKIYQFFSINLTENQLQKKRELIRVFGRTIGKMHAQGIFHGDLRLGNVLAKQEKNCWRFFFIDNERTKKFRRLPLRLRIKNLVQINMIPSNLLSITDRMRFFKEYCAENTINKEQRIALIKKIIKRTEQRLSPKSITRRELRKCMRTNERYVRVKTGRYIASFEREFYQAIPASIVESFLEQLDALLDKGQIFKSDNTTYVSRLSVNGKDLVVKRYNHKGIIHSLRHTIKKSRARRGWLNSHRLCLLQIPTPRPLAYIEQRKGILVWQSYFITEYVEGQRLYDFLRDNTISEKKYSEAIRQIKEILDTLEGYRITHGDLKHTNILIAENGPILTDLDGITMHRWNWMYKIKRKKDLNRLTKYGQINLGFARNAEALLKRGN
jgi:tRNA A-37 threonylcarbamoyl transferase component Bud32